MDDTLSVSNWPQSPSLMVTLAEFFVYVFYFSLFKCILFFTVRNSFEYTRLNCYILLVGALEEYFKRKIFNRQITQETFGGCVKRMNTSHDE